MKKARKILLTLCAALLLVTLSVGATIAYLTDTASVKNTFTVGNVDIKLEETVVDVYGKAAEGAAKAETGNKYKLVPSHTYKKDPTITVIEGSENCWLFAKLENGLGDRVTFEFVDGWTLVKQDETASLYVYKDTVAEKAEVVFFNNFTTKNDAVFTNVVADGEGVENATAISVTAYAIQADGLTKDAATTEAEKWAFGE